MREPIEPPTPNPSHPLASDQPHWKIWVVRVVVFSAVFVGLLAGFAALGELVERFFVAIYLD